MFTCASGMHTSLVRFDRRGCCDLRGRLTSGKFLCGSPVNILSCPHTHAILTPDIRTQEVEEVMLTALSGRNKGKTGLGRALWGYFGLLWQLLTLLRCPQTLVLELSGFWFFSPYMEQKDRVSGNKGIRGKETLESSQMTARVAGRRCSCLWML